jgi:hypothetical protein
MATHAVAAGGADAPEAGGQKTREDEAKGGLHRWCSFGEKVRRKVSRKVSRKVRTKEKR